MSVPLSAQELEHHPLPRAISAMQLEQLMPLHSLSSMRQTARACDFCRQRKRRCDGPKLPHRICTTCSSLSMECTYGDDIKRTPEVSKCYVAMLEARLAKVEKLVKQHSTEKMLMPEVGCIMSYQLPSFDPIHIRANIAANSKIDSMLAPWQTDTISHPSSIIEAFQKEVAANGNAEETAGSLKPHARRPYYWSTPAHEFRGETMASRAFDPHLPLPDELAMLTRYFFDQYNVFNGVLHRGLFEQQLLDETILSDPLFVALVLLVCAIGERTLSSSQERGEDVSNPPGWRFFEQVEPFLRAPPPVKPRLLYQQILVLSTIYLMATPGDMSLTWIVFGMSVQASYYANANCRKAYHQRPNLTDELWKRAFWQMVVVDRSVASIRGQPVIIPDEAFDLELPLDVDDAHWDLSNPTEGYPLTNSPSPNLTQPSSSGFFIWRIRLSLILGFALRTLYCNNRSRMMMAFVGSDWEWRTINRVGRLLREWEVSIPTQFRWDPDCPDLLTYVRSANLYANFYILQITAFNPFIRGTTATNWVHKRASQDQLSKGNADAAILLDPSTSLALCTKAAMACTKILAAIMERSPQHLALPGWLAPPFYCGLVLMVNLFGFKGHLTPSDIESITAALRVCLDVIAIVARTSKAAVPFMNTLLNVASGLEHELPPSRLPENMREAEASSQQATVIIPDQKTNCGDAHVCLPGKRVTV